MDGTSLQDLLRYDFSQGNEAFRDALLRRCLSILSISDMKPLSDEELEELAAAGDFYASHEPDL